MQDCGYTDDCKHKCNCAFLSDPAFGDYCQSKCGMQC